MKNLKSGVYSSKELEEFFGNRSAVHRMRDAGEIITVARGYYATNDIDYDKALYLLVAEKFPEGVLSSHSCLYHLGLSDYIDDKIHLDYPRDSGVRTKGDLIETHRVTKSRLNHTRTILINGVSVRTYTPERALFEAVRLERGIGETTIKACRNFVKKYKVDFGLLNDVAEEFGENGSKVFQMIQALRKDIHEI